MPIGQISKPAKRTPAPENIAGQEKTPESILARDLLKDFLDAGLHPLENAKLYVYLGQLPEAKLKLMLTRFEKTWYSPGADSKKLSDNLGQKLLPCLFHPGVAIRLDDFISHIQEIRQRGGNELSPLAAIRSFSDSLGTIQLYRSMAILPQEAKIFTDRGNFFQVQ